MNEVRLMLGDCLELMLDMPDGSVDLILTDPPYFKVKGEAWDNQWARPQQFLTWLDNVLEQFQRILKPSGSLYLFAGHKMAGRVECLISDRLRVLNHIVWVKPDAAGAEKGARAGKTRAYVPQTERILFACHPNPLGDALRDAMKVAGLSALEVNRRAFGRSTGLISLWLCDRDAHGACEPSIDDWLAAMRACGMNVTVDDYAELARPFSAGRGNFSDAWAFSPVKPYPGKHPCEKPQALLKHIISCSSKPGDLVFDAFAGTGSAAIAAIQLGRNFLGIEMSERYASAARRRIDEALTSPSGLITQSDLFTEVAA